MSLIRSTYFVRFRKPYQTSKTLGMPNTLISKADGRTVFDVMLMEPSKEIIICTGEFEAILPAVRFA